MTNFIGSPEAQASSIEEWVAWLHEAGGLNAAIPASHGLSVRRFADGPARRKGLSRL